MSFLKNKKLFLLCGLIVSLLVGCTPYNKHTKINDAIIHYCYNNLGFMVVPLGDGRYFLLDTGTEMSIVFRDRIKIKSVFRKFGLINRQRLAPIRNAKSFQIGDLLIENFDFVHKKSRNTLWENDTTIVGIIGMDIFSKKYSYFDIENQIITFSSERKNQIELPSFVFFYKSPIRPLSNLCINGIVFENVLFDTGFNSFLDLLETDKEVLNLQILAEKTMMQDILNNLRSAYRKTPDFIKINNVRFDTPTIIYSKPRHPRLLGMGFVRHWSSFLIDPFERKIEFYL